jgi:hypothetical protein
LNAPLVPIVEKLLQSIVIETLDHVCNVTA